MLQVKLIGLDAYMTRLKAASGSLITSIDGEVEAASKMFVAGAKKDLRKGDRGKLRQSINYTKLAPMSYSVGVPVFYAPYVEFGTKKKVIVEPGFESEASAAKGLSQRGGQLKFIDTIREWVKRKGLARIKNSYTGRSSTKKKDLEMVTFLIARSILRNGINPKPFFFKQYSPVRNKLIARVKKILSVM